MTTDDSEDGPLVARLAQLRYEHESRSEMDGVMRSRAAYQSWCEPLPLALAICTRDELVAEYRYKWLRDAEATIRTLDNKAFNAGTFHVIDGRDIGMQQRGYFGFSVGAHLHDLARDYLPRSARCPVAAVAVNVEAVARVTVDSAFRDATTASQRVRAAVACIAAHEYAHHVVALLDGDTLPPTASIEGTVGQLNARGHDKPTNDRAHGAAWVRGYAHLVHRAAFLPHRSVWLDRFRADLRYATAVDPDAVLDALRPDFDGFAPDALLVEMLRSPAPAGFLALFDPRDAARSAMETTNASLA